MTEIDTTKDDAIQTMKLVIEWGKMHTLCMKRKDCNGCPYYISKVCIKWATQGVMIKAARLFERYLKQNDL